MIKLGNQLDNLNRAKRDQKNAEKAERDARKAFEATPRSSNLAAKRAWDSTKDRLSNAQSDVRRYESELADANRNQARSWI